MSRMICAGLFVTCALVASAPNARAQEEFSKSLANTFTGAQFRNYRWLDYPLDNFGVATAYRGKNLPPSDEDFLCSTFTCLGLARPAKPDLWLKLADGIKEKQGFAEVGCGGAVEASLKRSAEAMAEISLPRIASVLGLSAGGGVENSKTTRLIFGQVCVRKLLQGRFESFISSLKADPYGLKAAYERGNLVLLVGDLVVTSMEVTVSPSSKLKAQLEGTLSGKPTAIVGKASASGAISKSADGSYNLKVNSPVIIGYLAVHRGGQYLGRPMGAVPGGDPDWLGWQPTAVMPPRRTERN